MANLENINWGNYAKQDRGAAFVRKNPIPLDAESLYYSYSDALAYASGSPVVYAGQVLTVVNTTDNVVDLYKVRPDRTLEKIGGDVAADVANISADVQKIQNSTGSWDNSAAYLASSSASLNSTVAVVNASASIWSAAESNSKAYADQRFNTATASLNSFTASQATVNANLLASASAAESASKAYTDQKISDVTASQATVNANLLASASAAESASKAYTDEKFNTVTASLNEFTASQAATNNSVSSSLAAHDTKLTELSTLTATHSLQIEALEQSASAAATESATHMKLDGSNSNITSPISFANGAAKIQYNTVDQSFEFIFA